MSKGDKPHFITPDWPAPPQIKAYTSTRLGGVSPAPYDSFNLGNHVNDDPNNVIANRQRLIEQLALPGEPCWLNQTHGDTVIDLSSYSGPVDADASFTTAANQVSIVMTADCLPILLCQPEGPGVAAIHASWPGFLSGIIPSTLKALPGPADSWIAWLGPAISQDHLELDTTIYQRFIEHDPAFAASFVQRGNSYYADLYALARYLLKQHGITGIFGGEYCTYRHSEWFFSYRRDQRITGRMASLIYRQG